MSQVKTHSPIVRRALRNALGQFATGVTIVTAHAGNGGDVGITCNSFSAVSLEPPLVLWSLTRNARSLPIYESASHFVIHVLAADQLELSQHFARQQPDKFANVAFQRGAGGCPIFENCAARFECRKERTVEAGDHVIFLGLVEKFEGHERGALLFHRGAYALSRRHPDLAAIKPLADLDPDSDFFFRNTMV